MLEIIHSAGNKVILKINSAGQLGEFLFSDGANVYSYIEMMVHMYV
jgi:hypothetical protein